MPFPGFSLASQLCGARRLVIRRERGLRPAALHHVRVGGRFYVGSISFFCELWSNVSRRRRKGEAEV